MNQGPLAKYRSLVEHGALAFDPAQALGAEKLEALANRLALRRNGSSGFRLNPFARKPEPVLGLYLYGPVGRGKTMLLDLFAESEPVAGTRRLHFQEFMAEAHEAIEHARRQEARDAVPLAATELAENLTVLLLDELEINDIADAMVVGRLFEALHAKGVVLVATSNTAPQDLYEGGLNRELFLTFIKLIGETMEVHELASSRDYRLEKLAGSNLYVTPADEAARASLDASWQMLTGRAAGEPDVIPIKGRTIRVPRAALGVARFHFDDLCEAALGPGDYQAIARRYHTVLIDHIPVLGPERRNAARRLTTLIDALYDNGVGLIASAEAAPSALYRGDDPASFARTASRLMEMRSSSYLEGRHRARSPSACN